MRRGALYFLGVLFVLIAGGAAWLAQPICSPRDARDQQYFQARQIAECVFDATSAVCGVGLLSGPLEGRYSPTGRWSLWGLGVAGAIAYLIAFGRVIQNFAEASIGKNSTPAVLSQVDLPRSRPIAWPTLLLTGLIGVLTLTLGVFFAGRLTCPTVAFDETLWLVGCAFFSIGLTPNAIEPGTAVMLAAVGLIGALGWPLWLVMFRGIRRREIVRLHIGVVLPFSVAILLATILLWAVEMPRGGESIGKITARPEDARLTLSQEAAWPRFFRSGVAVANALNGIAIEPMHERSIRDSSKVVLAGCELVGGLAGGMTGGVTFTLLWLGWLKKDTPWRRAAVRTILGLMGAAFSAAFGMILLETMIASRYQPAPTFADAFMDGASLVAGANLTSGLTATLTARNLISGIGLGISFDLVGMGWLVLWMLFGRVLPLWVLASGVSAHPCPQYSDGGNAA